MKDYSVLLTCGETAMVIMHDAFDKGYEQGYKDGKSEKNREKKKKMRKIRIFRQKVRNKK